MFIHDVIKKMQDSKTEHTILCMNENDVNIAFKPDTPSDQNRLVCESLKSKTGELSTLFLCYWNDPCWLYLRWTIFIVIWIVWLASWMIKMYSNDPRLANSSTGMYLMRPMNIEPKEKRMMPGLPVYKDYSERLRMGLDCDEVYPGIIIGTGETVKNFKYLQKIGVTHVLNTAENDVTINPQKFRDAGICYKGFRCPDLPHADISQFFDECVEFIDRALSFSCGLVFVNCLLGFSRSTAIVSAYLMKKKGLSASESLALMRQEREVKPNVGFLCQIGRLDDELRKERFRAQATSKCMPESPKFFRFQYKKPIQ